MKTSLDSKDGLSTFVLGRLDSQISLVADHVDLFSSFAKENNIPNTWIATAKAKKVGTKAYNSGLKIFPPTTGGDPTSDYFIRVDIQTGSSGGCVSYNLTEKDGHLTAQEIYDLLSALMNQEDKQTWIPGVKKKVPALADKSLDTVARDNTPPISFPQLLKKIKEKEGRVELVTAISTFANGSGLITDQVLEDAITAISGKELESGKLVDLRKYLVDQKIIHRLNGENYYLVEEEEEKKVLVQATTISPKEEAFDLSNLMRLAKEHKQREGRISEKQKQVNVCEARIKELEDKLQRERDRLKSFKEDLAAIIAEDFKYQEVYSQIQALAEIAGFIRK